MLLPTNSLAVELITAWWTMRRPSVSLDLFHLVSCGGLVQPQLFSLCADSKQYLFFFISAISFLLLSHVPWGLSLYEESEGETLIYSTPCTHTDLSYFKWFLLFIYSLHRLSDIVSILQTEISWSLILKFFLPRVLQNQMIRDTYTPESTEALKRIKYVTLLVENQL